MLSDASRFGFDRETLESVSMLLRGREGLYRRRAARAYDGADLSPAAVDAAFSQALPFFARYFPDYRPRAFLCVSWLLYPPMAPLLPPDSNIARFAARWEIIASAANPSEGIHRIYGGRRPRLADYPQETSLQRAALHHFSCLGESDGIVEIT